MSSDDARGVGEVLAEHECLYDRRVYPSFECSCGEWDGAQDDDGSESDGESDNAGAWRLHAADALLASPQLARLIEQREAAARAEGAAAEAAKFAGEWNRMFEAGRAEGRREVREAVEGEAFMEPWGPFPMGGFEGCTDPDPAHCACATDEQPKCEVCGQEIEPGEMAWARNWPCYPTLPLDHRDQDWDVISWHDECPRAVLAGQGGESGEGA
jgi:hypothetical protein